MTITLRVNSLGDSICSICAKNAWSVRDVKQSIEAAAGIPSREQRLVIGCDLITDNDSAPLDSCLAKLPQSPDGSFQVSLLRRSPEQAEWLELVAIDAWRLVDAPTHIREDKEVVFKAVQQDGSTLEYAASCLQADPTVVLAAMSQDASACAFAASSLWADRDFVLAAVQVMAGCAPCFSPVGLEGEGPCAMVPWRQSSVLEYATADLRADKHIVMTAIRSDWRAVRCVAHDLHADREVMMLAVQCSGLALEYASAALRNDRSLVLVAVRGNGVALAHAAHELRADHEIVLAALQQSWSVLPYVWDNLCADPKLARSALMNKGVLGMLMLLIRLSWVNCPRLKMAFINSHWLAVAVFILFAICLTSLS